MMLSYYKNRVGNRKKYVLILICHFSGLASLIGLGMASPNPAFTTMTTTLALSGMLT